MRHQRVSRTQEARQNSDAAVTGAGKRGRPSADVAEPLRVAYVAYKEVAKGYAQWWNSELRPRVDASRSSAAEGAEAATSALVADECKRVLGQKLSEGAEARFST